MSKFHKGDKAIFYKPDDPAHLTEVEVMSELFIDGNGKKVYLILVPGYTGPCDGGTWEEYEQYLRKKRPPRAIDKKVSWKDMPWIPDDLKIPVLTEEVK